MAQTIKFSGQLGLKWCFYASLLITLLWKMIQITSNPIIHKLRTIFVRIFIKIENPWYLCHLAIAGKCEVVSALIDFKRPSFDFLGYPWVGVQGRYNFFTQNYCRKLKFPLSWPKHWICVTSKCHFLAIFSTSPLKIPHSGL